MIGLKQNTENFNEYLFVSGGMRNEPRIAAIKFYNQAKCVKTFNKKEHVWCKNSGVENTIDINTKILVIRGERETEREKE